VVKWSSAVVAAMDELRTVWPEGHGTNRSGGSDGNGRPLLRTPALMAWLRLMRVWHKVERASSESLRDAGLTPGQFAVLAHVGAVEGMAQGDLARKLAVTQGNVCQLIDRMERAGLLARRPEGRTNRLALTAKGRALFDRVVPAHEEQVAAQFAGLTHQEQTQLHRLLRDLDRSIGPAADNHLDED
jgi:DNA-binding MarR family transcriptional regulator